VRANSNDLQSVIEWAKSNKSARGRIDVNLLEKYIWLLDSISTEMHVCNQDKIYINSLLNILKSITEMHYAQAKQNIYKDTLKHQLVIIEELQKIFKNKTLAEKMINDEDY
jgi:hypothetical protein